VARAERGPDPARVSREPVDVRRATEADWEAVRSTRLHALADRPEAFDSSRAREAAWTGAEWRSWIARGATFLLEGPDGPQGIVAGVRDRAGGPAVYLVSMWVRPDVRGTGAADALAAAVVAWAAAEGAPEIRLHVDRRDGRARRFYERNGFRPVALDVPRESDGLPEIGMRRGLTPADEDLPEHVRRNRARWDAWAEKYVEPGEAAWARESPTWGIWDVPESDVGMLPADLAGRDAIELGCGTAYVSAWMARRGARVVGIDNSEAQLATARRLQRRHGLDFPLIHGNAETVPCPDASFDFAISEYGACLWADPRRWVPEAARLLRPGGRLAFLVNSHLISLCTPDDEGEAATDRLLRPAFGLYRLEFPGDSGVEFHLTHGGWIRLLRDSGFEIEDLVEIRPPETATTRYPFVTVEWARRWPAEEVWKVRKRA